jgi:hypothetical protein
LIPVAALALIAGAGAIVELTEPQPSASGTTVPALPSIPPPASTTTTAPFTVARLERGQQFDWTRALTLGPGGPMSLIEHEGSAYLFSTGPNGDLETLVSSDGVTWDARETDLVDADWVSSVISTPFGLLAQGAVEGRPATWLSTDGLRWRLGSLPFGGDELDYWVEQAIVHAGGVALFGTESPVYHDRVMEALEQRLGSATPQLYWSPSGQPEGSQITVHGPLGIALLTTTLEELGLTTTDLYPEITGQSQVAVTWASSDGVTWVRSPIGSADYVTSPFADAEGRLWALSYGPSGETWHTSTDALTWETGSGPRGGIERIQVLGDGYVGIDYRGAGPTISTSPDLSQWEPIEIGLGEARGVDWQFDLAISGEDLYVVAAAWDYPTTISTSARLSREGNIFVYHQAGLIEIEDGEGNLLTRFPVHSVGVPEGVEPDIPNQVISFSDPGTGEHLMTLSFQELIRLEEETWSNSNPSVAHVALAHSTDGDAFAIQNMGEVAGEGGWIQSLLPFGDQVILVTGSMTSAETVIWVGTASEQTPADAGSGHGN